MERGAPSRTDSPGWPRVLVTLVTWVALFAVLAGIHAGAEIIGPLLIALNLFIAAWPVRTWALRRGARPVVATLALGLVVFVVFSLAIFVLGWSVSALVRELPEYQGKFVQLYNQAVDLAASVGITQDQILAQLKQISPTSVAGVAGSAASGLTGALTGLGVLALMLFLLLLDAGSYPRRSDAVARFSPMTALAIEDFVVGVRRYWVVTSLFGLVVAVLDVALLLAVGVPLALVWGLVSFLTNYIPNVGFLIGLVPPALMALLAGGPTASLVVVIGYVVINVVIQTVIQPKFSGDAVGITALVSFLSLLVWGAVLGPLGALLGVPATLLLKALLVDHDPALRWFNAFLASDPLSADPEDADVPDEPMGADATLGVHDGDH